MSMRFDSLKWRLPPLLLAAMVGRLFWPLAAQCMPIAGLMIATFALGRFARIWGYLYFSVFYLAGTWPLVGAGSQVLGADYLSSGSLWLAHGLVCSLPILLLRGQYAGVRAGVVALLYILPPFGYLAPCNPATLTGLFFPRTGIAGVVAFIWLAGLVGCQTVSSRVWRYQAACCIVVVSLANAWTSLSLPPPLPSNWISLDTQFGENGSDEARRLHVGNVDLPALVATKVANLPEGTVVFLAEGLLYDRSEFTDVMWARAIGDHDVTFIVGANTTAVDGIGSVATVQVFGNSAKSRRIAAALIGARAAVTFPATMWHPWRPTEHFAMHPPSSPFELEGQLLHISWCYESTIMWPHLVAGRRGAEVMLSAENRWSTAGTSLEDAHTVVGKLVGRWLGTRAILAINR